MNIKAVGEKLVQRVANAKVAKKEANIAKFVNLENVRQEGVYRTLYDAREVLANYAKAKGIKIEFHSFPESAYAGQSENLINMAVRSKKACRVDLINTSNETTVLQRPIYRLLTDKDGLDYMSRCKQTVEDGFLRRVYRTLEMAAKKV